MHNFLYKDRIQKLRMRKEWLVSLVILSVTYIAYTKLYHKSVNLKNTIAHAQCTYSLSLVQVIFVLFPIVHPTTIVMSIISHKYS